MPVTGRPAGRACVNEKSGKTGDFLHVVFFWLKDDSGSTRKKFLSELREFIDNVDLIRTKHIGSPADTDREVIDSTWSYSLILSFDSKKEQDLYQDHPLHKRFIENASSLWEKVQVYDSLKLT
ncbi:MAG: Dabb family protein [Bacteroidetes bacterium]|nr:Dabb family protein [Bacteroidota bacterium]